MSRRKNRRKPKERHPRHASNDPTPSPRASREHDALPATDQTTSSRDTGHHTGPTTTQDRLNKHKGRPVPMKCARNDCATGRSNADGLDGDLYPKISTGAERHSRGREPNPARHGDLSNRDHCDDDTTSISMAWEPAPEAYLASRQPVGRSGCTETGTMDFGRVQDRKYARCEQPRYSQQAREQWNPMWKLHQSEGQTKRISVGMENVSDSEVEDMEAGENETVDEMEWEWQGDEMDWEWVATTVVSKCDGDVEWNVKMGSGALAVFGRYFGEKLGQILFPDVERDFERARVAEVFEAAARAVFAGVNALPL